MERSSWCSFLLELERSRHSRETQTQDSQDVCMLLFIMLCYVCMHIYIYIYACSLCLFNNSCQSSLFSFVRVWAQLVNQEYNRSVTVTRQAYMNICMSLSRYIYILAQLQIEYGLIPKS